MLTFCTYAPSSPTALPAAPPLPASAFPGPTAPFEVPLPPARVFSIGTCNYLFNSLFFIFIKCIAHCLIQLYKFQVYNSVMNTSSVYCIMCSPPKVKSTSVSMCPPLVLHCSLAPLPSGNRQTVICVYELLFVCLCSFVASGLYSIYE